MASILSNTNTSQGLYGLRRWQGLPKVDVMVRVRAVPVDALTVTNVVASLIQRDFSSLRGSRRPPRTNNMHMDTCERASV